MNDNLRTDSVTELLSASNLNFSPSKKKDCTTCAHDPTYEEMKKGIVCKSTIDCVDDKQWEERLYANDWYVRNKVGYTGGKDGK